MVGGADIRQLYNRQEYVVGTEVQAKYAETDVLIIGLSGLGCEIAKNLVLTGVRSVSLLDETPLTWLDMGSNFFVQESDLGQKRSAVVLAKLAEMNRFVSVRVVQKQVDEDLLKQFHVAVFVDHHTTQLIRENNWCRNNNVRFVSCEARGLTGCIFVDGGLNFAIHDATGEETATCIITAITNDGTIMCHEDKKHECEVGSHVYITGCQKPEFVNSDSSSAPKLFEVTQVVGPYGVRVACPDLEGVECLAGHNAYLHTTKKSITVNFKSLEESLASPEFNFVVDAPEKLCSANELHTIYSDIHEHGIPQNAEELCETTSRISKKIGDSLWIQPLLAGLGAQISPLACIIGGLASQEALKLATGKFTPIQQWFYWDCRELTPYLDKWNFATTTNRCAAVERVFGSSFVEKLRSTRAFIVGAGALGCEHIKNAALMGLGKVSITDMDTIETSNLSRQFLFRSWHVGQSKSVVAATSASTINPSTVISALEEKVCRETESLFNSEFWDSHDVVLNALDNIAARLYVDERCVAYQKPLFESGTLGTKCNAQVVIPHVTENYGNSRDPQEKSIPLCTLKHFPSAIEHTIQWARDLFHQLFVEIPSDIVRFRENPTGFLARLESEPATKQTVVKALEEFFTMWPRQIEDCVRIARLKFEELFHNSIAQLLFNFPLDKVNDSGESFWNSTRKPPTPAIFNPNEPLHRDFVHHTSILLAQVFSVHVPLDFTSDSAMELATSVSVLPFVPSSAKFATTSTETEQVGRTHHASLCMPEFAGTVVPLEFEKDDDSNHHIDFITTVSNLRAAAYGIIMADRSRTKMIAGNIIPAMVTTTSLITGFVMLEVLKYVGGAKSIETFRNHFLNIALPVVVLSDPIEASARVYKRPDGTSVRWTMWDRIDIDSNPNITVIQLVEELQRSQLDIFMITLPSGKVIYSAYGSKKDHNRPVAAVAKERGASLDSFTTHLMLIASGSFGDQEVDVPQIRVRIAGETA